ncbi:DUF3368 domain-containing protein [Okeania sp. KiyG1]|uniref:DUF3368 domain-containing protein n=1 Tax=Okeania sp. KiyG1 TaxID=2720165 RepID=UPI0019204449|nr:DUF3368 domain-containing protein [Okeania sp. KiyG1]GGA36778.1 hypothetical protein CYANOKiyG1_54760 [Okeania sp. KiyG1]
MAEFPAVNTSPLIFLTQANLLDFLQILSPKIIVPQAVATEIQAYGNTDVTAQMLVQTDWLVVTKTPTIPAVIQSWDLGVGESEVLSWGYHHPNTEVIIDDLGARCCAQALEIPVRGTLGLVLTAKQRGVISEARPVLEQLRLSRMYLSERLMNQVLMSVGE